MKKFAILPKILLIGVVALTGCELFQGKNSKSPGATKPASGKSLVAGAKSSKTHVMSQKTAAKKATKPPKAVPAAVKSGSAEVTPPPVSMGGDVILETWEIAEIDLDGSGDLESGVALYDGNTDTLYVWWTDLMDLSGDGDIEELDGFLWISDASAGLILEIEGAGLVACLETADAEVLIVCDAAGDCEVLAMEEVLPH